MPLKLSSFFCDRHWNVFLNLFAWNEEKESYVTHLNGYTFSHERLCTNFAGWVLHKVQGYFMFWRHLKVLWFKRKLILDFSIWNDVSFRKAYYIGMVSINRLKFFDGRMPQTVSRQGMCKMYNKHHMFNVHLMFNDERR